MELHCIHLHPDRVLLADNAYDAQWIRKLIEDRDAVPIIPDWSGAKTTHAFSKLLYRRRNQIERCFGPEIRFLLHTQLAVVPQSDL